MSEGGTVRRRAERRLVTILACDFVGFSLSMSRDEEGTARILKAHRAVIDSIIDLHDGRIFSTAGDSVLAEFSSPVEAVRCATEIQDALGTRNASLSARNKLTLRIGINLGDVLVSGSDLLGDAVNVAARLEGLAEPGGICISGSVHEQVRGKMSLSFEPIGATSLKHIERPVDVYRLGRGIERVDAEPAASTQFSTTSPLGRAGTAAPRRWRTPVVAFLALISLCAAAALAWYMMIGRAPAPQRIETGASAQHWLNGRWVGIVGPPPPLGTAFCADLDDRCRVLVIFGVTGDGGFTGSFGFPNRLAVSSVDVRDGVVQIKTGAPTFVEVKRRADEILDGTLKDRFGATWPIRLRRTQ